MGCTSNKEVVSYDPEHKTDDSVYYHSQISADLENTRKDHVSLAKLLNYMNPNVRLGNFATNVVSTDEGQKIVTMFKHREDYERVASTLAILSHKDPSTLTTMNPNSVNDIPQLHLPEDLVSTSTEDIASYTNEKGYSTVLFNSSWIVEENKK